MKKLMSITVLVVLLLLVTAAFVYAEGEPAGGCPPGFELHPAMPHDDHHGHRHVGTAADQNGDGWICVRHVSVDGNVHVHIDNRLPLP